MLSLRLGIGPTSNSRREKFFIKILDSYGRASGAYSLRRVMGKYEGYSIRVRRSTDNTETNIGFINNLLDTASLLTFCQGGNGYVSVFYDQSGKGYHMEQSNASRQPQIVESGVVITMSGKPSIKFYGTNYLRCVLSQPLDYDAAVTAQSTYGVIKIYDYANSYFGRVFTQSKYSPQNIGGGGADFRNYVPIIIYSGAFQTISQAVGNDGSFAFPNTKNVDQDQPVIVSSYLNNETSVAVASFGLNNQSLASENMPFKVSYASGLSNLQLGCGLAGGDYEQTWMYCSELLNYFQDNKTERTNILNNINGYYNIY